MAKSKPKLSSPFTGRWRIVSMSTWEQNYIDEEEEGYFEFDDKGWGEFHFGYGHGQMDCRLSTRESEPVVEWTWDGNAELDGLQDRDCAGHGLHDDLPGPMLSAGPVLDAGPSPGRVWR